MICGILSSVIDKYSLEKEAQRKNGQIKMRNILITGGPTNEYIDEDEDYQYVYGQSVGDTEQVFSEAGYGDQRFSITA